MVCGSGTRSWRLLLPLYVARRLRHGPHDFPFRSHRGVPCGRMGQHGRRSRVTNRPFRLEAGQLTVQNSASVGVSSTNSIINGKGQRIGIVKASVFIQIPA